MSNYVYGYVQHNTTNEVIREKINVVLSEQIPGIREIDTEELYCFPVIYLPQNLEKSFIFELTDNKENWHAQQLVNGLNYASEADFDLPKGADERATLLVNILCDVLNIKEVERLLVSIYDAAQSVEIELISDSSQTQTILMRDLFECMPPDILYVINKK